MAAFTRAVLALGALAQSVAAFNCSMPPVYVDIHKRIVHGTDIFQYGSFMGVGSPGQNQSLFPSLRNNETSVASVVFCDNSNLTDCRINTHGNYDSEASSTFENATDYVSLDHDEDGEGNHIREEFHLYTHFFEPDPASATVLEDFPVRVMTAGSRNPGVYGMGSSSTLMSHLVTQNRIASHTWSLYVGAGFDRAGGMINGSNTFGGVDVGRFEGTVYNYTMDLNHADPFPVRVKDVRLDMPSSDGARNVSLLDASRFPNLDDDAAFEGGSRTSFEARLSTDVFPFVFPDEVTRNFMQLTGAEASEAEDGSLRIPDPFNGTLAIELDDGFTVTLTAAQLRNVSDLAPIRAPRSADASSSSSSNSSSASGDAYAEPFYLGLAYLAHVYLMADYDAYAFHLAAAIVENRFVTPRTWCGKTTPVAYSVPAPGSFVANGMIGAVIGGVVGGLGLVALVITLFVVFKRRQYRKRERMVEEARAARTGAKMAQFVVDESEQGSPGPAKAPKASSGWLWRR
ncbi:hypothetical protein BDY21DRAFT_289468 [Lineolata rhizophorae]|uniref:Peptidase A1 domain-containing protein n=1 Tax=Lineolata rhizophorae TaxID=578093 RepID=A0A6A6NWA0_9PEZI|nr:hypothetical protein BDY21DRAFT_289468 [Lineolata rhizophorae]